MNGLSDTAEAEFKEARVEKFTGGVAGDPSFIYEKPAETDHTSAALASGDGIGAADAQPSTAPTHLDTMSTTIDNLQAVLGGLAAAREISVRFVEEQTRPAVAAGVDVQLGYITDMFDDAGRELSRLIEDLEKIRNRARAAPYAL